MTIRLRTAFVAALLATTIAVAATPAEADPAMPLPYPETRRDPVVETQFGDAVADPYRWLENDVRSDKAVAEWVARQNAVTADYLGQLPQRDWFAQRIRTLMDYERFGLPQKAGKRYFYTRNSGDRKSVV